MSTALYRRYRPETFAEVIGQEHVTRPLSAAIDSGRINHAYLFSGPRGCGKTTSARILARCLNCAEGPTSTPCGVCAGCRDLANDGPGSLDVVEIDAASHNGVDDARDLRERAVYAPARDRYKVFILDEAHMVTAQGFNALLKLVEEPPPHVKFVFATTEPDKVIGTIRSRTHHYPFRLVPPEILTNYLEDLCGRESVPVGKGVLPLVVRAGGGSVRDTLSVLDQLIAGSTAEGIDYSTAVALLGYTDDSLLGDIVDAFSAGDGAGVFRAVERVVESGHDPRRFVEDLLERFRDLFVIAAAPDSAQSFLPEVPADRLERLMVQARAHGPAELSRAADLLNTGLTEMSGATSPRLQLELICARILLPGSDDSRGSVISRVDRLERRIGMSRSGDAPPGAVPAASGAPAAQGPGVHAPAETGGRGALDGSDGGAGAGGGAGGEGVEAGTEAGPSTPGASTPATATDDPFVGMADAMASARSVLDGGHSVSDPHGASDPREASGPRESAVPQESAVPHPAAEQDGQEAPAERPGPSARVQKPAPQESVPQQPEPGAQEGTPPADQSSPPVTAREPAGAEIDAIRRGWPDVLSRLQQLRRLSHAIVSANAFPQRFADGVLYLAFNNPGSVQGFLRGPHAQFVSSALEESLGIRAQVQVGDDNAGPLPPPGGSPGPAGSAGPSGPGGHRGHGGGPNETAAPDTGRLDGPAPRQPSQEEMERVVGPREADRAPVDHERFWQTDDVQQNQRPRESAGDQEGDRPAPLSTDDHAAAEPDAWPSPPESAGGAADAPQAGPGPAAHGRRETSARQPQEEATSTSAGARAVDLGAVVVPPPVDIDPDSDSGREHTVDDEQYAPDEPPYDPEYDGPATAGHPDAAAHSSGGVPSANGTSAGLDLLGAYADVSIAFTDNPGYEEASATAQAPVEDDATGRLGRYAHLARRHSTAPDPGERAVEPVQEHVPDPVENYTDYDTEGDADLDVATESGPAVVERILGGTIIEEIEE